MYFTIGGNGSGYVTRKQPLAFPGTALRLNSCFALKMAHGKTASQVLQLPGLDY